MVKSYKNLNLHLVEYEEECKETEAAKDGDQNKNNIINVDRKVILSMKQSQEYAERVNHILQNANEVTSGFIEDCIQHAKELSDDETICTVGKIETKLIDDGGKPALVTSVHFEYTSKHSDEVREHRWDGNVKNLKKEYIQKIAEKFVEGNLPENLFHEIRINHKVRCNVPDGAGRLDGAHIGESVYYVGPDTDCKITGYFVDPVILPDHQ